MDHVSDFINKPQIKHYSSSTIKAYKHAVNLFLFETSFLPGHNSIRTTQIYTHVSTADISSIKSLPDNL